MQIKGLIKQDHHYEETSNKPKQDKKEKNQKNEAIKEEAEEDETEESKEKDKNKEQKEEEKKNDGKEEDIPMTGKEDKKVDTTNAKEQPKLNVSQPVLQAFEKMKFKLFPTVEEFDKIPKKAALKNKFDVIVIGIPHIAYLKKPELLNLAKDDTIFYIEKPQYFVTVKKEDRVKMSENIKKLAIGLGLKEKNYDRVHHLKFSKS